MDYTTTQPAIAAFEENTYGHLQRLRWLRERLEPQDRVLDFGCGTGIFITMPLLAGGYDVTGVDLDLESIEYGRARLEAAGLDEARLQRVDARSLEGHFDAIIVSEVLEHMDDRELDEVLELLHSKLVPEGKLLVTVPNGYGWYELESFVWYALRVGRALGALRRRWRRSAPRTDVEVMTLAPTPHLQRFTWRSLRRKLANHRFEVTDGRGAVLVCGPISDFVLSGRKRIQRLNRWLGRVAPPVAADFYVLARRRS
jgi:SAM-dependent methyltransferase